MKQRSLLIYCYLLISFHAVAQTCSKQVCSSIGGPVIGNPYADMEKYLARTLELNGLVDENTQALWWESGPCWDPTVCYYDSLCYGKAYCPSKYCADINLAVSLNASMLFGVVGFWDGMYSFAADYPPPGVTTNFNPAYIAAKQAVIDINHAYDCAGLRRPIIGAGILENLNENEIENIQIPNDVLNLFAAEISQEGLESYYIPGIHFSQSNIVHSGTKTPDISKLEARMFFYFMAKRFIDIGYTEITPDFLSWSVSQYEDLSTLPHDQLYWTQDVLQKVRAYAASISQLLVIPSYLNNPHDSDPTKVNIDEFFYNGNAMFDFRYGATRPYEVSSPAPAFTNFHGATTPSAISCTGHLNTVIVDSSQIIKPTVGGVSPYSGVSYPRIPFLIGLDTHGGICNNPVGYPTYNFWCPWGYDECRLFNTLGFPCQADYMRYLYMQSRTYYYRGFAAAPGMKILNSGNPSIAASKFRMVNNTQLVNEVKNDLWKVNLATTSYEVTCEGTPDGCKYAFIFKVDNPDNSSVYTWHVLQPDGNWLPYTYGDKREIIPTMMGTYQVGLRQDNWGLEPMGYPYGVYGINTYFSAYSNANPCCGNKAASDGNVNTGIFNSDSEEILISPNPASNAVNIQAAIGGDKFISLEIYNTIGQLIKTFNSTTQVTNGILKSSINLSDIKAGLYVVEVRLSNKTITKKLSVVK